jgi:uncharacterized protein (DUF433 family)
VLWTVPVLPLPLTGWGLRTVAELIAFTTEHVCRLTGLSTRQVWYWNKTEFFSPALVDGYRSRAFSRIYSFRDVVGLRTIAILRKEHRTPLQELRRVGQWLKEEYETPWSSLRFGLGGRKVIFFDPTTGVATEPRGQGQTLLAIALEPIANEMRTAARRLTERQADEVGQIVRNRYVVHNAWSVAGTRIPTEAIWNFHHAGYSSKAIIHEYPRLTAKDVAAAIKFETKRKAA